MARDVGNLNFDHIKYLLMHDGLPGRLQSMGESQLNNITATSERS